MPFRAAEITIPNVRLTLEDLLGVIHGLDEPSRARVARAVAEAEMDARFKEMIDQLAARIPPEDITDSDIDQEVQAVRRSTRPA